MLMEKDLSLEDNSVERWTKSFLSHSTVLELKNKIFDKPLPPTKESAAILAEYWYEFSSVMPWFLCLAGAKVSTNEMRQSLIRVAHEELGEGDANNLHCEKFRGAVLSTGIDFELPNSDSIVIGLLKSSIKKANSPHQVLGLCLGLEIIANENIDFLFRGLAFDSSAQTALEDSYFFKIHRVNEDSHIFYNVSNFLKFCSSSSEKKRFLVGFENALDFWRIFWMTYNNHITLDDYVESVCHN